MDKQPYIILSDRFRLLRLALCDICLLEVVKGTDKCRIVTAHGAFIIRIRLGEVKKRLDERFVYATRSSIVNRDKIIEVDKRERTMLLIGGITCPYTRLFTFK